MTVYCIKHNKSLSCCVCLHLSLYLFCLALHCKQNIWIRAVLMQSYIIMELLVCVCSRLTASLCISGGDFFSDSLSRIHHYTSRWRQVTFFMSEWVSKSIIQPIHSNTLIHLGTNKSLGVFFDLIRPCADRSVYDIKYSESDSKRTVCRLWCHTAIGLHSIASSQTHLLSFWMS